MMRGGDWFALGTLLALKGAIVLLAASLRPDLVYNESHLFGDIGANYQVTLSLDHGKVLGRDLVYPYGPLSAHAYRVWSWFSGNNIKGYVLFHNITGLIFTGMVFLVVRRGAGTRVAFLIGACLVVLMILTPATLFGNGYNSSYAPLEQICLLGLTLAWQPPTNRSAKKAFLLGVLLGLWQLIKFGGAFFAGAAILLIDIFWMVSEKKAGKTLTDLCKTYGWQFVGFLIPEISIISFAFATNPWDYALDIIWPAYAKMHYDSTWSTQQYPTWSGISYFFCQQFPYIIFTFFCVYGFYSLITIKGYREKSGSSVLGFFTSMGDKAPPCPSQSRRNALMSLLIPALFYLFGSFYYFGHVFNYHMYSWCLVIGATVGMFQPGIPWRLVLCGIMLPPTLLLARNLTYFPCDSQSMVLKNGDRIYVDEKMKVLLDDLAEIIEKLELGPQRRVLFTRIGAGYHVFHNISLATRHMWYITNYVRPYEEQDLLKALEGTCAVVAIDGIVQADSASLNQVFSGVLPQSCIELLIKRTDKAFRMGIKSACFVLK